MNNLRFRLYALMLFLPLFVLPVNAQDGNPRVACLDTMAINSDYVFVGKIVNVRKSVTTENDVDVNVERWLKGEGEIGKYATTIADVRERVLTDWKTQGSRVLIFLLPSNHSTVSTGIMVNAINLSDPDLKVLTADMQLLRNPQEVLRATANAINRHRGIQRISTVMRTLPDDIAAAFGHPNQKDRINELADLVEDVPVDADLERWAQSAVNSKRDTERQDAARALGYFPSDANAAILKRLLDDPAVIRPYYRSDLFYFVRDTALDSLKRMGMKAPEPAPPADANRPDPPAQPTACRAAQIEIYDVADDAGTGHSVIEIGLRNISNTACAIFGIPGFRIIDAQGIPRVVPYVKNQPDFLFEPQPKNPVNLAPGAFAFFFVGSTVCSDDPPCVKSRAEEFSLPGDATWLRLSASQDADSLREQNNINVSAVRERMGNDENSDWRPSLSPLPTVSGSLSKLNIAVHIPEAPASAFSIHFTLRNKDANAISVDWKQCTLNARYTNSVGKTIFESQPCARWLGEISAEGNLAPHALASMDLSIAEKPMEMCRQGIWQADLQLVTSAGTMNFKRFPFANYYSMCSDSTPVEMNSAFPNSAIRWTLIPHHGVRLGVVFRAENNSDPEISQFDTGLDIAAFHAGRPIEMHLFLDNLTDDPVTVQIGPGDFRLAVRRAGRGVRTDEVQPKQNSIAYAPAKSVTVAPHTQIFLETELLTGQYDLPPGEYQVIVAPRTLQGDAATANAPATGPLYAAVNSPYVSTLIKIIREVNYF